MENVERRKLCVVCLKNEGFSYIFEVDSNNLTISQKIFECSGVELTREMDFPDKICRNCKAYMTVAYKFRVLVRSSFETLQDQLKNIEPEDEILTENTQIMEDNIHDVDQYDPSNENIQEIENLDNIEYEVVDSGREFLLEEVTLKQEENVPSINETISPINIEVVNMPTKRMLISDSEKFIKERPSTFVCELCGNQYKQKHALDKHVRWHNNEKPYTCEICSKTFAASSNLRRHMYVHTGQKPYKCKFCSQKFAAQQTKNNHERIHTGERPFACKNCGKTFSYSHVLVNHMLTHSGEKAFECVPCNKKFTKRHHLKAHMETLVHKSQVEDYEEECVMKIEFS